MRWGRITIAIAVAAGVSAVVRDARADGEATGAKWTVEAEGVGCERHRPTFERELVLACQAMSTCRVVPPREAELVATLRCDPGMRSWWLSMRTAEGTPLSSVELSGTSDDALREGAIEVAHDAAPERTLAMETLRNTLSDRDAVMPAPRPPRLSMTVGGVTTARSGEGPNGGLRASAGYEIGDVTHLIGGLMGSAGGSDDDAFRRFRTGVGVAFGAPFTTQVIGVSIDAGIDVTNRYDVRYSSAAYALKSVTRADAYLQQTFFLQLPLGRVRPYAALGLALVSADPIVMGSADVGLLFPVF